MSLGNFIKRGIKFIISGIPEKKVTANIAYLAPSEMLKGRSALITGGTSGIGYEMAKAFVNAGASCIITGRNNEKVQKACAELEKELGMKGRVFGLEMDVTNIQNMKDSFNKVKVNIILHVVYPFN